MAVPLQTIEELVSQLRNFVPRDLDSGGFKSYDVFFQDFENFKLPLISYLAEKTEEAMVSVPSTVSEEFLKGYLDGVMSMIRIIADLKLVKNHHPEG